MSDMLIYGATGYTGRLIVERALARGIRPVIGGRSASAVAKLAARHGLRSRVFDLDAKIAGKIAGVGTVLHAAGPFSRTSTPMLEACLEVRANYIDITGEIDVFEAIAKHDQAARSSGIVLLPGAGFDVVPSDCLAAHVKRRLPSATRLDIVIGGLSGVSRGTAKTMAEGIARGIRVRADGIIVETGDVPRGTADFGGGLRPTVGVSWGDVATAYHSTGIPDIRVFFEATSQIERALAMPHWLRRLLSGVTGQHIVRAVINRLPAGPDDAARATGRAIIIALAEDPEGARVTSQLETPEAYHLTAQTAVEIARRVDAGEVTPGFHTPSTAFGPDFVLGFGGVSRRDLS